MTTSRSLKDIKRVLVALDATRQCHEALEAAARLAARREAELIGLFVEDRELLEAAALPVTRLIRSHDLAEEALDAAKMQQGLRAWAAQARATFASVAQRWQVKSSFRVTRGGVTEELIAEARGCDLLALPSLGGALQRQDPGAVVRMIAEQAACTVMLMRAQGRPQDAVLAVYEGAEAALRLAQELAQTDGAPLEVLAVGSDAAAAEAALEGQGPAVTVRRLEAATAEDLRARLAESPAGTLVIERHGALGAELDPGELLKGPASAIYVIG